MSQPSFPQRDQSGLRIAFVATYPPRRCGIATFTRDLIDSIARYAEVFVAALEESPDQHRYSSRVRMTVRRDRPHDYVALADRLNAEADVVNLQHEYGLFGGEDGRYVLALARELRVPLVTTLHTVLKRPTASQRAIVRDLARFSTRLVVINSRALSFLTAEYGISESKVSVIPHGIPDLPLVDPETRKPAFGLQGRRVLLSFGLLSPSKGFEHAIRALPTVAAAHPDVIYVIAGSTHPGELRERGESYRQALQTLAGELGVSNHLRFIDRFLSTEELSELLLAADVYVAPYPNEEQISSGTLAYALGSGTAVVSTPFWHAQELLAEGRGVLVPFADPDALASEVVYLLDHDRERERLRRRGYEYTRNMTWPAVGVRYLSVFADATRVTSSARGRSVSAAR
jgi:glycosyltransferase involved in cell wall biosynthesis